MKHVVMLSGGLASWLTARRVADRYGSDDLVTLFTDTNQESDGLYRFLAAAERDVGGTNIRIDNDGRTPWDAMKEARYLGSAVIAVCSRILKQEPARKWIDKNCDPEETTIYIGMDALEGDRINRVRKAYADRGWKAEFPLAEWKPEVLWKREMVKAAEDRGLPVSPAYDDPLTLHDNCDGMCVRMGQAGWVHLLRTDREKFLYAERKEREVIDHIAAEYPTAMLKDRRGGDATPMTLRQLRERAEALGPLFEPNASAQDQDCGGCFTLPNERVCVARGDS